MNRIRFISVPKEEDSESELVFSRLENIIRERFKDSGDRVHRTLCGIDVVSPIAAQPIMAISFESINTIVVYNSSYDDIAVELAREFIRSEINHCYTIERHYGTK